MFRKSWSKKGIHPENHNRLSFNTSNESVDNPADDAAVPPPLMELPNLELREDVMRQLKDARKIARHMQSTEDLVEYKIRKSMEQGEFNNIEGKGKPIDLEENPYEDPTLRLPFKMLKDAGFAPYWIELGKDIDAEIEGARTLFDMFLDGLRWRKERKGYLDWNPEMEERRDRVLQSCARKLGEANKKTDLYNRIVPIYWMQRKKVDENIELSKLRKKWDEVVIKPALSG